MDSEKIKQYLLDFQERSFLEVKSRDLKIEASNKIQTIIGARRTGKTYLLYEKINELEKKGIKREQIIYLNFESPTLNDIYYKEIKDIIELHWSLFPEIIKERLYIFIDEPQTVDKWELAIREIYDNFNCYIFLTGSSSKLLSKEIATSLRGRCVTSLLLPLCFKEFLRFKEINFDVKKLSTKTKAKLRNKFNEYLIFGGYPEVVLEDNENEKIRILKDYFDLIIYKDIIDRYKIKDTNTIKWMIDYLVSSIAKETSINKIYKTLKSKQVKISKNTLYEYFSMLEDSCFILPLRKFDYSIKNENLSIPKIYLNDIAFLNLFTLENFGKRMENIVYLELVRKKREQPLLKINYWKTSDGKEVDFIIKKNEKIKQAIQVCYNMAGKRTKEREMKSLLECLDYFKLTEGLIITKNTKSEEIINKKRIKTIPIWQWLLDDHNV